MNKEIAAKLVDAYGMACEAWRENSNSPCTIGTDLGELCDNLRDVIVAGLAERHAEGGLWANTDQG